MKSRQFLLLFVFICVRGRWDGQLKYNTDHTFTILQLTDFHYGEDIVKDIRTMGLTFQMIRQAQPDLVVLTGDQFSGYIKECKQPNPVKNCYQKGYEKYTLPLKRLQQKYCVILGNHDDQADLNRDQIVQLDMTNEFSLTNHTEGLYGSNYYLPIFDQNGQSIETLLWLFDSHAYDCLGQPSPNGCVEYDQIEWFQKEYKRIISEEKKEKIQGISFVHIPPPEYIELVNNYDIYGNSGEDSDCPCQNSGFVSSLMLNDVQANFVGHDHDNDFSGFYEKNGREIDLHYGRKTGYGSYGPPASMQRGGKVIKLRTIGNGQFIYDTYVIDEAGNTVYRDKPYKQDKKVRPCPCD